MPMSLGVIIPFHNNHVGLQWILEALTPQLRGRDEVVVVDDHSDRPPSPPDDMPCVRVTALQRGDGPGNRAGARNDGWRACDTDVVVFLDGDMVPSPTFLDSLRCLHQEHDEVVVKPERFAMTREEQARGKAACLHEVATQARWFAVPPSRPPQASSPTPHWYYAASNALSVERQHVERIGGWDEEYHGWGEEDMDFAYRLHRAGLGFIFPEPESLYAVHLDHDLAEDWVESLERNASRFVAKYPEVYDVRVPAYRACGLAMGQICGAREPNIERNRALAYAPRAPWG
jgi:GT2 family glycosyltransferase